MAENVYLTIQIDVRMTLFYNFINNEHVNLIFMSRSDVAMETLICISRDQAHFILDRVSMSTIKALYCLPAM